MLKFFRNTIITSTLIVLTACSGIETVSDGTDRGMRVTIINIDDGTDRHRTTRTQEKSTEQDNKTNIKEEVNKIPVNESINEAFFYPIPSSLISKNFNNNSFKGLEFTIDSSTEIYAIGPGMVIFSGVRPSLGNTIFLYHNNGYVSVYTNLDSLKHKKGDYIRNSTDIIGTASNRFNFELRKRTEKGVIPVDPSEYLKDRS